MMLLILGLVVFLSAHSTRIVADGWRTWQIDRLGEQRWKAIFSLVSLLGLALIVWGYGASRAEPVALWQPPGWTRHLAAVLMLPAFVLLAAAYVPGNRIKALVGHPMVLGTEFWAVAHLLANGNLADVLLFGSFLVWAVVDFAAARRRDRSGATPTPPTAVALSRDALVVVIGVVAWNVFAWLAHRWLFGVAPFG
ncbi:conserved membrane hypothetical protein [Candidatus Accumulibacter aalborgensis]|uniref:NnrU domain-containing protein n=1 Tax=Candidatus Accumulibacter aalborgensis TaxID=1860102 RepID=A0A1A8XLI1_9PROT|nr:NnrU family protein [Candidatus Accumulibacter aalborgensis]SBT06029.1 conserved membrane hypothetical protein [Candidatus Accumulibacter aalborgensis]